MRHKELIVILFGVFSINSVIAQKDTLIIEKTTESVVAYDNNDNYTYLEQKLRKEKSIVKIGVTPYLYNEELITTFPPLALGIERKITKKFSVGLYSNYYFKRRYYGVYNEEPILNVSPSFTYYYQMKKRIKSGNSVSNFHGNYFSLKIDGLFKISNKRYTTYYPNEIYEETKRKITSEPLICLEWGIQRRFWRFGYFDLGPFVQFNHQTARVGAKLTIGLGFGFKK